MMKLSQKESNRRLYLHSIGLSDTEMGRECGETRNTINAWRQRQGLPLNRSIRYLTDAEKTQIRLLHGQDNIITEISRMMNRTATTVRKFCRDSNLDTSRQRAKRIGHMRRTGIYREDGFSILDCLHQHGPCTRENLLESGFSSTSITKALFRYPDDIERIEMRTGTRHGPSRSTQIFADQYIRKSVYAIKGDERVVDYLVERIIFRPKDQPGARVLFMVLKKLVGEVRARTIVEKLGYKYKTPARWDGRVNGR